MAVLTSDPCHNNKSRVSSYPTKGKNVMVKEVLDNATPEEASPTATVSAKSNGSSPPLSATKAFASFVANFDPSSIPSHVTRKLRALFLDYIGVCSSATQTAESSPSFKAALQAISANQTGNCTIMCLGSKFSPSTAALFGASFAHSLDYDDTHVPGSVHPGVTVISAALAQAEVTAETTPMEFLAALAVGYETVCRLAKALGTGGYAQGFHNTSTTGIFGAVAAICKIKRLDQEMTENAFGLALSKAAGSMQYLENGSWNKRLHPGFAASDALLCVTLAEAGVIGAAKPIEGKYGLLNAFAKSSKPEALDLGSLGQKWEFMETAVKPFPACRMTHGQIEMAANLRLGAKGREVKRLVVGLSEPCVHVVGAAQENKIHPRTIVDAQFSSYYQTAVAFQYGSGFGWGAYEKMEDSSVRELCDKITIEADKKLTGIESWLRVEWDDGTVEEQVCKCPKGERERPINWDDVKAKFESLAEPVYGQQKTEDIIKMVEDVDILEVRKLMGVLSVAR